jgi:hypothetical protein
LYFSWAQPESELIPRYPIPDSASLSIGERSCGLPSSATRQFRCRIARARDEGIGESRGSLPSPEVMGQIWQVPFAHPAALDSQMIMVGVTQSIPAPGVLSAREQSMAAQANQEAAMAGDRARMIRREAGNAFADYTESSAKHRIHRAHLDITRHLFDVAEARHATGGSLIDVTRTQVELSRMEANVVTDATLIESACHLNALLAASRIAIEPPLESESVTATDVPPARKARGARRVQASRSRTGSVPRVTAPNGVVWPSFSVEPFSSESRWHGTAWASMSLPWPGHRQRRSGGNSRGDT